MNSSAKRILIGWIYRRIGFLKHGMKKQIKPLAAILRFLDFSIPRYRHFERSEKSSLHPALSCSFRKRFPLFRYHTYGAIPVCQKDPSASLGMTLRKWRFPQHILYTGRGLSIPPYRHFQQSREIILALHLFLLPSQMDSPSLLSHIGRYTSVPEGSLHFGRDDVAEVALSKHIRCTLREINPFPHTVISSTARNLPCTLLFLAPFAKGFPFSAVSHRTIYTIPSFRTQSRNLPCTLLFLAPFAKGFPFSAVSHRTLYQCARRIPPLRSG